MLSTPATPNSKTAEKPYEDRTARKSTHRSSNVTQTIQQDQPVDEKRDKSPLSFSKNSSRSKRTTINLAKIRTNAY